MTPSFPARQRDNSSRVNLLIAFVFHAAVVLLLVYFAAREGLLGEQFKKIAVEMVKEKTPEKPKEPDKPREEAPKPEPARAAETPKPEAPKVPRAVALAASPSSAVAPPPAVAPPADELPAFDFDGGKAVQTSTDPAQIYKGFVEYALRANWTRPDNVVDDNYIAEVEISVDRSGQVSDPLWKKRSGDERWDDSVRAAIAATKRLNRAPPANFPARVVVRFDVQDATEPVVQ